MPTPKRRLTWAIPDDWTENDGTQAVVFCIPNSLQWKVTITGLVTQLLQGRSWDKQTGNIKQTQEIGREVFESMAFLCLDDLGNIVTAIDNLTATIALQGGEAAGCGCTPPGKDTTEPPPIGTQGDPPPEGYVNFTDLGDDKCISAHILLDDIEEFLQALIDVGAQRITWALISTWEALLVIVLAQVAGGPIAWGLTILAAIGALIWALMTLAFDLERILTITTENRNDLVCAAYQASDNEAAWNAMQTVYSDNGALAGDLAFLEACQIIHALFTLFFLPDTAEGEAMQAAIDNYGPVTCDCPTGVWINTIGTVDQPDRIYDALVSAGVTDYTTYWEDNCPNNVYCGLWTPCEDPDPPVPEGNPTTLTWRFRFDYKQPSGRGGWVRYQVLQGSDVKISNAWVCSSGCYGTWNSIDVTVGADFNTTMPMAHKIIFHLAGEKNYFQFRNVIVELVDNP